MDEQRRCPDCAVTMEPTTLRTGGGHAVQLVSEEARDGILGSLGVKERHDLTTVVCPECGLVRTYADVDE